MAKAIAIYISIHAPRTGSDLRAEWAKAAESLFQSTLPARGATFHNEFGFPVAQFQSTLPARGATCLQWKQSGRSCISIHAPRTGSDVPEAHKKTRNQRISIHAPRTGSDGRRSRVPEAHKNFNPRSPHGERLLAFCDFSPAQARFQSTLPARGATRGLFIGMRTQDDFNPRSPHGERR